ncbi:arsenate reductase/protein-tyrosine-phosphatase family protein [Luteibaculum oceani]|uniref:Protein-tyrosine-phosphatase n=1 Tax=Luteibaculum oceani TaxID=1294296 RepID=A0A5C6UWZ6_9FLAO|nr:protein-tyrosine-phosphatase [Luteibaculum oceani]TXC77110.1 protein-tyrosine-phosphatase [Luteibaculum oceani]
MNSTLKKSLDLVLAEIGKLPEQRRELLSDLAKRIADKTNTENKLGLVFVCTQNSRRSFFSEVWAQLAIEHFKLGKLLQAFSAGSEASAIHPNTISTLESQGYVIEIGNGNNPLLKVFTDESAPLIASFSKDLNDKTLPKENFIAIMVCSDADKNCPFVPGALFRQPVTFDDPKIADGTPEQKSVYEVRSLEIARNMFFLMSEIDKRIN